MFRDETNTRKKSPMWSSPTKDLNFHVTFGISSRLTSQCLRCRVITTSQDVSALKAFATPGSVKIQILIRTKLEQGKKMCIVITHQRFLAGSKLIGANELLVSFIMEKKKGDEIDWLKASPAILKYLVHFQIFTTFNQTFPTLMMKISQKTKTK